MPALDLVAHHRFGLGLDRVVDRERDALALPRRPRVEDVDRLPRWVADDSLAPRGSGQRAVETELESCEPVVIGARVPDHLRRDLVEGVDALFLVREAEAEDVRLLQDLGAFGVGLTLDVDESVRPIGELGEHLIRVHPQRSCDDIRGRLRVADQLRVREDRCRLSANRELDARTVEDRPPPCGLDDRRLVLAGGEPLVAARADSLEPRCAREHREERESEDDEDEPDSPVRQLHLPRSRYSGVAGRRPSWPLASPTIRPEAALAAISVLSWALSARSWFRSRWVSSSRTLRRSTATFSATTPASRAATRPIQTTPPATRLRGSTLRFARGFGRGRGRAGAGRALAVSALAIRLSGRRAAWPRQRAGCWPAREHSAGSPCGSAA